MATEVLMPKMGLTMTEGTIEEWKFKEGDTVKKGDILFSVATDKLTIELSSRKVAQAIAETTGAQVRTFHSCQTVSRAEFDSGVTYLQLMEANADALREGLS